MNKSILLVVLLLFGIFSGCQGDYSFEESNFDDGVEYTGDVNIGGDTHVSGIANITHDNDDFKFSVERLEGNVVYIRAELSRDVVANISIEKDGELVCNRVLNYNFAQTPGKIVDVSILDCNIFEGKAYDVRLDYKGNVYLQTIVARGSSSISDNDADLVVVYDSSCKNCEEDLFVSQVKNQMSFIKDVKKIAYNSEQGRGIVDLLDSKTLPIYLFSEKITHQSDWDTMSSVFELVEVDGVSYYMLDQTFVSSKILIEDITISDNAIVLGDSDAPVTLYAFFDYECPYCAIAFGNDDLVEDFKKNDPDYKVPIPEIYDNYVEKGKVKIVFYNNPIISLHSDAKMVHVAGLCANQEGIFKEFNDMIWSNRADWIDKDLDDRTEMFVDYADDLGVDRDDFEYCLENSNKYDKQIDEEMELAKSYGISGTPVFWINKNFISGAQDYSVFEDMIESELDNN